MKVNLNKLERTFGVLKAGIKCRIESRQIHALNNLQTYLLFSSARVLHVMVIKYELLGSGVLQTEYL